MDHIETKISIITPCYNSLASIKKTINSVINNQNIMLEYLIIDGGSTDGTYKFIKELKSTNIRIISEKDHGPYDAMNKGIRNATGEIIGIINSDDWYEPKIISKILNIFDLNKNIDLIHGDMNIWKDNKFIRVQKPREINRYQLLKGMPINHPTCFVRKEIYHKYGLYDITYRICADSEFVFRLWSEGVGICYLPEVISNMNLGGLSDRMKITSAFESFNIKRKFNFSSPLIYYYLLRSLMRVF